ncbi:MAG: peroxiredoxin family protein [archaeon]|nr:peroxiredoxin family protein [archaeon]
MAELRKDYEKFEEMNAYLYPVLVDGIENAQKMEQKYARNKYAIYYDESKKVSKMLSQQIKVTKLGRMPGLLIVDKQGIVQYAYYGDSMKDIPENKVLFEVIERINK